MSDQHASMKSGYSFETLTPQTEWDHRCQNILDCCKELADQIRSENPDMDIVFEARISPLEDMRRRAYL